MLNYYSAILLFFFLFIDHAFYIYSHFHFSARQEFDFETETAFNSVFFLWMLSLLNSTSAMSLLTVLFLLFFFSFWTSSTHPTENINDCAIKQVEAHLRWLLRVIGALNLRFGFFFLGLSRLTEIHTINTQRSRVCVCICHSVCMHNYPCTSGIFKRRKRVWINFLLLLFLL